MAKKIVTFGEAMLRLTTRENQRFARVNSFDVNVGGAEVNTAVALARLGVDVQYVTAIPDHELGDRIAFELAANNVGMKYVQRNVGKLGIYYYEPGTGYIPSNIIYDREGSCISKLASGSINWREVFGEAEWFHFTGITPGLSQTAAQHCLEALKTASKMSVTISCDLNFRKKLWNYGVMPKEVLPQLFEYADMAIVGESDCKESLGVAVGTEVSNPHDRFETLCRELKRLYPKLSVIAGTKRYSRGVDQIDYIAFLFINDRVYSSSIYQITQVIGRIGVGDAFAAALIHALGSSCDPQTAINFAAAAGCIKHSIPGDFLIARQSEITALALGGRELYIQR